jgi:hypothetical protein
MRSVAFILAMSIIQPPAAAAASHATEIAVTDGQQEPATSSQNAASIEEPPGPAKLDLIRRYLRATGMQRQIDTGSFLERFALPGGPLTEALASRGDSVSIRDMFAIPIDALRRAYEPHRQVWQEEYERHLNWEYTEEELGQIVTFLESDAGQHYLEGDWRMRAYVWTNTEELLEQIVRDAEVILRSQNQAD